MKKIINYACHCSIGASIAVGYFLRHLATEERERNQGLRVEIFPVFLRENTTRPLMEWERHTTGWSRIACPLQSGSCHTASAPGGREFEGGALIQNSLAGRGGSFFPWLGQAFPPGRARYQNEILVNLATPYVDGV
jgi:hypothetical protein